MRFAIRSIVVVSLLAACGSVKEPDPKDGNAELGITEYRVTETADQLDVVGVNAADQQVARIHLRVGHVSLPDEGLEGPGRELLVIVGDRSIMHESVGRAPLSLPIVDDETDEIEALLLDPYVAHRLAAWDIEFEAASEEAAPRDAKNTDYGHYGSCAGFEPPCNGTGATHCCLEDSTGGDGAREQYVTCGYLGTYSIRRCEYSGASTSCGTAGGGGCANCWNPPATMYTDDVLTPYVAGSDSCSHHQCNYAYSWCGSNWDCCNGACYESGFPEYNFCLY